MNTLTVNLHLLMASFYRPTAERFRILIEETAFPSDLYAVQSQAAWHGHDPADAVVRVPIDEIAAAIGRAGDSLALALLPGVNYLDGQVLDVAGADRGGARGRGRGRLGSRARDRQRASLAPRERRRLRGLVPLQVRERGPGRARRRLRPRAPRQRGSTCRGSPAGGGTTPRSASAWSRSSSRGSAPRAGPSRRRPCSRSRRSARRSSSSTASGSTRCGRARVRLTGYVEELLDEVAASRRMAVITPRDTEARGCQLSVSCDGARSLAARLRSEHGVVCDFREPDVLRFAPVPLYNTYEDCRRAAVALLDVLEPR